MALWLLHLSSEIKSVKLSQHEVGSQPLFALKYKIPKESGPRHWSQVGLAAFP
jgi:hypothetical protein